MKKDTFYFSHDFNARTDDKIKALIRKHGMTGYGIFWAIIEDLYNNANALRLDCDGIAFDLRTESDAIKSIIEDFGLFVIEDGFFGSLSVQKRLDERQKKENIARENAYKRWKKPENNATALPLQSEPNAIKERKGNKGKEIKESKVKEITELIFPFNSEEFMNAWNILVQGKKWKNKPMSSLQASLKKLSELSEQDAIACIEDCIAGNWQGIFTDKYLQKVKQNKKTTNAENTLQVRNNVKSIIDQLDLSGLE